MHVIAMVGLDDLAEPAIAINNPFSATPFGSRDDTCPSGTILSECLRSYPEWFEE